jgi:hypothetical protein
LTNKGTDLQYGDGFLGIAASGSGMGCLGSADGDIIGLGLSGGSHGIIEDLSAIDTRKLAILIERTREIDVSRRDESIS